MSDLVVSTRNLSKSYTLFPSPRHRTASLFGLGRARSYPTHPAVDNVSLDICAGERVAFIGRNGAGKSTLLKLITGVIEPTSGTVSVSGATHALLQMGAGFHPEFSGRQNAVRYLSTLGLKDAEISKAIDDIIEFSELEEYIDQPLKTYSTGMQMRLIFAASTTVAPRLFVVDEVLGVGDAYFQHKSFNRIQELSAKNKTTLLLVSHDIYTAAKLCDRMIWIDRGRIKFDGEPKTALNLYESSIKEQEEQRLRRKTELRQSQLKSFAEQSTGLFIEIACPPNSVLDGPVYFSEIKVTLGGKTHSINLTSVHQDSSSGTLNGIITEQSCWGEPQEYAGQLARPMKDHGSTFRKVQASVALSEADLVALKDGGATVMLNAASGSSFELRISLHTSRISYRVEPLRGLGNGSWNNYILRVLEPDISANSGDTERIHGTGDIHVTGLRLLDQLSRPTLRVQHGSPVSFEIDYVVRRADIDDRADLLIGIHRDGAVEVCRLFDDQLRFNAMTCGAGTICVDIGNLILPNGSYTVSLTLAKLGYFKKGGGKFYSVNEDVHTCLSRFMEIQIFGGDVVASGIGVVLPARWRLRSMAKDATGIEQNEGVDG